MDHFLSALMYAHPYSPVMSGEVSVEDYLGHAQKVNDSIAQNGGVTVSAKPGSDPMPVGEKKWYGVGGAKDYDTGQRYPEKITRGSINETLAHILDVERGNISRSQQGVPPAHVGGWSEGGETVLDATSVTRSKRQAMRMAYQRGERKVFDAKNIDELDVELDPRDVGKVKKNPGVS